MRYFLIVSFLICSSAVAQTPKQKPLNVCINQTNGKVQAKARCSRSERVMSQFNLGATCVKRSATESSILSVWIELKCNSGEYLQSHGVRTSTAFAVVNEIRLLYSGEETLPSGVGYYIAGAASAIQGTVEATCCLQ